MFQRSLNGLLNINANEIETNDINVSDNIDVSNNIQGNFFYRPTYQFFHRYFEQYTKSTKYSQ